MQADRNLFHLTWEAPFLAQESPQSGGRNHVFSSSLESLTHRHDSAGGGLSAIFSHESGHNKSAHVKSTSPHHNPSSSLRLKTDGSMRAYPTLCVCVCLGRLCGSGCSCDEALLETPGITGRGRLAACEPLIRVTPRVFCGSSFVLEKSELTPE